jgi:hypothetical protein
MMVTFYTVHHHHVVLKKLTSIAQTAASFDFVSLEPAAFLFGISQGNNALVPKSSIFSFCS